MTMPYEAPKPSPTPVPPNRVVVKPGKTLALWLVLIVVFVAVYQLLAKPDPRHDRVAPAVEVTEEAENGPIPLWPLGLPVATFGVLALAFRRIRERLPARYRTMELKTEPLVKPAPEPVPPAPPMQEIALSGKSGDRKVRLRIGDGGLRWFVEKTLLLHGEEELEIGWEELDHASVMATRNPLLVWGILIGLFGGFYGFFGAGQTGVAGPVVLAVGAAIVGISLFLAGGGQLTLATKTHQLVLTARALDARTRDAILAAVRARRPLAVPAQATNGCLSLPWLLVLKPFSEIRHVWRSRDAILAEAVDARFEGDETRDAFVEQRRLFALWVSGLNGFLPLSFGVAAEVMSGPRHLGIVVWVAAVVAGLVGATRLMPLMARLSGMTLRR